MLKRAVIAFALVTAASSSTTSPLTEMRFTPDEIRASTFNGHTTIPAHSHRDDRMATVVSGQWYFGYGDRFDEKSLKSLPPGSVYSEPGGVNHFARTEQDAVIVHVSGYGPSDTLFVDAAKDPSSREQK